MSKTPKTIAKTPAEATRYDAFVVREYQTGDGETKSDWNRIGAAWPHADSKGFRLVLTAVPVDGVVVIRLHEPKDGAE